MLDVTHSGTDTLIHTYQLRHSPEPKPRDWLPPSPPLLICTPHPLHTHRTHTSAHPHQHTCMFTNQLTHKNAHQLFRLHMLINEPTHKRTKNTHIASHTCSPVHPCSCTHRVKNGFWFTRVHTHLLVCTRVCTHTHTHSLSLSLSSTCTTMDKLPPTSALNSVAWAMRAQLLVGGGTRQGTEFAMESPATATSATALHPGDWRATARWGLAYSLQHLGEARPLPDVCRERVGMVSGRNMPSESPFHGGCRGC